MQWPIALKAIYMTLRTLYSAIKKKLYRNESMCRQTGATKFDCYGKSVDIWVGAKIFIFCSS
jgi:hypothetical protein